MMPGKRKRQMLHQNGGNRKREPRRAISGKGEGDRRTLSCSDSSNRLEVKGKHERKKGSPLLLQAGIPGRVRGRYGRSENGIGQLIP